MEDGGEDGEDGASSLVQEEVGKVFGGNCQDQDFLDKASRADGRLDKTEGDAKMDKDTSSHLDRRDRRQGKVVDPLIDPDLAQEIVEILEQVGRGEEDKECDKESSEINSDKLPTVEEVGTKDDPKFEIHNKETANADQAKVVRSRKSSAPSQENQETDGKPVEQELEKVSGRDKERKCKAEKPPKSKRPPKKPANIKVNTKEEEEETQKPPQRAKNVCQIEKTSLAELKQRRSQVRIKIKKRIANLYFLW